MQACVARGGGGGGGVKQNFLRTMASGADSGSPELSTHFKIEKTAHEPLISYWESTR